MATSGVYSYQLTRDQIITAALRKLGVLAQGQTPSAQDYADATVSLNTALSELRTKGLPLWLRKEYTWTPTTGTYTIGTGQTLNTPYPTKLLQAVRQDANGGSKIDMEPTSWDDFNVLPSNSPGSPIRINYRPYVNYGTISLWPIPDSTNTTTVTIYYLAPMQYALSSADTLDIPEEWYNAVIYKLAVLLAPEWGVALQDRNMLRSEAAEYLDSAIGYNTEDADFYFQPDRGR